MRATTTHRWSGSISRITAAPSRSFGTCSAGPPAASMTAPRTPPAEAVGARGGRVLSSRRQRQRAILAAMAVLGILLGALAFDLQWLDSSLQAATYDTFITQAPAK